MHLEQQSPLMTHAATTAAAHAEASMRAAVFDRYGPVDAVQLAQVARPQPQDDAVLVRVVAAGLHAGDCFCVRGEPFPVRLMMGLRKPKVGIPGFDLAGRVEAVGPKVTRFKPGDEVFGAGMGSCAEYASVREQELALKPASLDFEQAAALTTSGLAALHALRDVAKLERGQKLLIIGAAGGVGHFAVQIAKAMGAEVTGVCSTRNTAWVRELGADRVIDYTKEDFTQGGPRYDAIVDNVENRSLSECRSALTPNGTLILNSGTGAGGLGLLRRLLAPLLISPFVRQNLRRYLSVPKHEDLLALAEMAQAGTLRAAVEKVFPLAQTVQALRHLETGHSRGKVVVRI
ncbi:MAG: NAD(P)-dependent alcohol dehydrogenase [Myxococcales bacterium]|nr:NAD(P)-dependent alcohol dehydrogenase [Myxococcales bacterium]